MTEAVVQPNLVQLVAFFLAEIIRSRRTSIRRAAEITEIITNNLPSLTSESQALSLVTEIEHDFEEVTSLRQALHFNYDASDVKVYEREIKEFAAQLFQKDMVKSTGFLKDASGQEITIQQLCIKYPEFCEYLLGETDKGHLLGKLHYA